MSVRNSVYGSGRSIGAADTKLGVAKRIAGLFPVMALAPGLALAEVAGSAFCLLSPPRRLLSSAAPTLRPLPQLEALSQSRLRERVSVDRSQPEGVS